MPKNCPDSSRACNNGSAPSHRKNLLEILIELKFPDSVLAIFLTFLFAVTLAPYMGGRSLWILGSSPILIPTISQQLFWFFIIATPLLWTLVIVRLFHSPAVKVIIILSITTTITVFFVLLHTYIPGIGLTAIDSSFQGEYEISAWHLTASHENQTYKFFRSNPIPLEIEQGCALRIESIEVFARGWAHIEGSTSGFDIQVFVSTFPLLPSTVQSPQSASNSQSMDSSSLNFLHTIRQEPTNSEVRARSVINVTPGDLTDNEPYLSLHIAYDFKNHITRADPKLYSRKVIERHDLIIHKRTAHLQLVGWTLYGEDVSLTLNDPLITVSGKKLCTIFPWIL
jgi:hypothetical protein